VSALRLIGVDVGGTFTDVVAVEGNRIRAMKVPTDPHASERSVLAGAAELDVGQADIFNLSTTAGLNAVITRRLPKVAFLTTIGHRDILDRGRIWRPLEALTDPSWRRQFSDSARPLVPRYLRRGIRERLKSDGEVLVPLDEAQARAELTEQGVPAAGVRVLRRPDAPWGLSLSDPAVERTMSLLAANSATHLIVLSHDPIDVIALAVPVISADPATETALALVRRLLALTPETV